MKIHIFQRHCGFSSQSQNKPRPEWFSREKCFNNLVNTVDNRVEVHLVYDNASMPLQDHFISKINHDFNIVEFKGGNDAQSFLNLLNYVKNLNIPENDIIYFLEDDYIHVQGWVNIMIEGFSYTDADYITLYDHKDKYFPQVISYLDSKILVTPSIHWRTTPSTTNTYACKSSTLNNHFNIHVKYCDLVDKWTKDHDKFTELLNNGSNLLSCVPGLSTHVESQFLSPIIDWEETLKY
jgi:hypothetical protein